MQARRSASFRGSAARSAERRTYAVNALARLCAHTLTSSADTINGNASPTLRDAITYANANPGTTITFSGAVAGQTITLTSPGSQLPFMEHCVALRSSDMSEAEGRPEVTSTPPEGRV